MKEKQQLGKMMRKSVNLSEYALFNYGGTRKSGISMNGEDTAVFLSGTDDQGQQCCEQFALLALEIKCARALPVYRENLSRPNRKRKQHLRCKRGLGKILVQRSTQTGQQGFCGMASPFTMLEHLA
ncbi:hypothetical protein T10_5192 [Trichinella papuae]|uniref:Uncharacterized protein n=1 Tax=Trichinella papuae TaxID=268474 RepID=A0A0V1MI31_9BILA|nr:hypothetical protein T10_5192 [Trichinella papuae]